MTTVTLCLSVIAIILAGIDYQLAGPNFKTDSSYSTLPPLQLACIIYSFAMCAWGYVLFSNPKSVCAIAFNTFLFLSLIFNFAIGVFALVAYNVGFVNTYDSCNGQFSGVLSMWQGMDTYLHKVNNELCSEECPCYLTNQTGYLSSQYLPMFKQMTITKNPNDAISFQNCSDAVKHRVLNEAREADVYLSKSVPEKFNADNFAEYMSTMEEFFSCTGWCNTTYQNPKKENVTMFKYLFSDINRGPAEKVGCLDSLINWLPGYLGAFGSMTMILAFVQIGLFIVALMIEKEEPEEKIPCDQENKCIKNN